MVLGHDQPMSREEQSEWMHSLRPKTAYIDFVFSNGDAGHPLLELLAHLPSTRTIGAHPGNGYYVYSRPTVVTRRYAYDRDIIRVIDSLGCFFPDTASTAEWTELGDVDVVFLDKDEKLLGATVTHEGMIITPEDEEENVDYH